MNPFLLTPHTPSMHFCDRKKETSDIIRYLENGANVALISPRRYGKTGLIYHIFDTIKEKKHAVEMHYMDIYATRSTDEFIALLAETIFSAPPKKSWVTGLLKTLGGLRPVISADSLSGSPQLSFTFQSDAERKLSLKTLLEYLEKRPQRVILAIDEFQQVRQYGGISMEALLRSHIQPLRNVQFIFSGSQRHMIAEMFTEESNPFYESASLYSIDKIDRETYGGFIKEQFAGQGKGISDEAVEFILDWTRCHTFYTQFLCNRVFQHARREASLKDAMQAADTILREHGDIFLERRSLLTARQWDFLIALAKEGELSEPTGAAFLGKHRLGSPSSASRLLDSLTAKELVLETHAPDGRKYCVYNVFFSRYLERMQQKG